MDIQLHADRRLEALVHGAGLGWIPSPTPGVYRRMLERSGGEVALASSIVRYAPGSRFPAHEHALGEEFMVLEGCFSDEHGDYPTGSYVRNPPGSSHAPFSREGCVIFVKLRQMLADEPETLRLTPDRYHWESRGPGHSCARLYANARIGVTLERLDPGAEASCRSDGGLELFVLSGRVALGTDTEPLRAWSWLRTRARSRRLHAGAEGALLWVKRGHLE